MSRLTAAQAFTENGLEVGEHDTADNVLATNNGQEVQNLIFDEDGKLTYLIIMVRPHLLTQ